MKYILFIILLVCSNFVYAKSVKSQARKMFFNKTSTFNILGKKHSLLSLGYGTVSWYPGKRFLKFFHIPTAIINLIKISEGYVEILLVSDWYVNKIGEDYQYLINSRFQLDINSTKNIKSTRFIQGIELYTERNQTAFNAPFTTGSYDVGISIFGRYFLKNKSFFPFNHALSLSAGIVAHRIGRKSTYISFPITLGLRTYFK